MDLRVGGRYRLGRKLGSSSSGGVYIGADTETGEELAIKLETIKSKHPRLLYESRLYKMLAGGVGVPTVHWYGVECGYNVMVLDLFGPSLEDLFWFCNQRFSLKTVLMLAIQMLIRIEHVHARNLIHRDVKPGIFLIGLGKKSNQLQVIDFGLARKYIDPRTRQHIPYREGKSLTGPARYISLNAHLGVEQSRRDDLESIGYVLMYLSQGSLPWQGLKAADKEERYQKIMEKKASTPIEGLCKHVPKEFAIYLNYTRSLRFEDRPDYAYLSLLLMEAFFREGLQYDLVFDWSPDTAQTERKAERRDEVSTARPTAPAFWQLACNMQPRSGARPCTTYS